MTSILTALKALPVVAQAKAWNDRTYITLAGAQGSRSNADLRVKIWIKGDTLTIEAAKGYHSDAFIADKHALLDAARAAGATIREI